MSSERLNLQMVGGQPLKHRLLVPKVLNTVVEIVSTIDPGASSFGHDLGSVEHHETEASPAGLGHFTRLHQLGDRTDHAFEEVGLIVPLRDAVVEGITDCKLEGHQIFSFRVDIVESEKTLKTCESIHVEGNSG